MLKNIKATYQIMVKKMFKQQIGRNVKAYMEDIIMKSRIANS